LHDHIVLVWKNTVCLNEFFWESII
jgi:hypothetical protein